MQKACKYFYMHNNIRAHFLNKINLEHASCALIYILIMKFETNKDKYDVNLKIQIQIYLLFFYL